MGELLVTEEVALLDGLSGRAAAEAEGATIAISFGPPLAVGLASILAADAVATATPAPVIALTEGALPDCADMFWTVRPFKSTLAVDAIKSRSTSSSKPAISVDSIRSWIKRLRS